MKVFYSPRFVSQYKRLPKQLKLEIVEKEKIFFKNPFNPKLKTHKLTGKLNSLWAYSIDRKHRIIFEFVEKNTIQLHSVGTHDIYKN